MPVFQTNVWVCELCGAIESTTYDTSPYSDPIVSPPKGQAWNYIKKDGNEFLACPKCQEILMPKLR